MTDSQKIDDIHKKIKLMRSVQLIVGAIAVLGFLGVLSISDVVKNKK